MSVGITLIVVRSDDLERVHAFYELLGLTLISEQHGTGPQHYSSTSSGTVFELYPARPGESDASTRLGFSVVDVNEVVARLEAGGYQVSSRPKERDSEVHAVVVDPDGRKVELTSPAV